MMLTYNSAVHMLVYGIFSLNNISGDQFLKRQLFSLDHEIVVNIFMIDHIF